MGSLVEKLTSEPTRPKVVQACVDLFESEVSAKRGLSGAAIKAGYKVVKTVKPGMVPNVIDKLLPEWAEALQPLYDKCNEDGGEFEAYLGANTDEAADALLSVTDARAERADNRTLKKTYERLRGGAKANVAAAVPSLAARLRPFV